MEYLHLIELKIILRISGYLVVDLGAEQCERRILETTKVRVHSFGTILAIPIPV